MKSASPRQLGNANSHYEACDARWFELDLPYLVRGETTFTFRLLETSLIGSKKYFLRFDLYPRVSPSIMVRHYGWWDIPLSKVRSDRLKIRFAPQRGLLSYEGRLWRERVAKRGPRYFDEMGLCILHVSIWEISGSEPRMRALGSYPLVLLGDSSDLPLKGFNIPVTDRCNLACTMCPRQSTANLVEQDISQAVLDSLIEATSHVHSVLLQGLGEPLLCGRLSAIMHEIKAKMSPQGRFGFTTNATLLNDQMIAKVLDAGTGFIYFSVDAATQATYEAIRVGGSFDQVLDNISRCVQLRRDLQKAGTEFMLNFVVTGHNYREVPLFVELAEQLGIENVTFSRCLPTGQDRNDTFDLAAARGLLEEAVRIGAHHGMNVFVPRIEPSTPGKCLFIERAVVMNSGDVLPCHMMASGYALNDRAVVFGNVREASLLDIWQRPQVKEFRRRVLEGDFPPECEGCECKAFLVP